MNHGLHLTTDSARLKSAATAWPGREVHLCVFWLFKNVYKEMRGMNTKCCHFYLAVLNSQVIKLHNNAVYSAVKLSLVHWQQCQLPDSQCIHLPIRDDSCCN